MIIVRKKRRKILFQFHACTAIVEWKGRFQINVLNAKLGPPGVWQIFHTAQSWKWKSGSLVSNFILITLGLFICSIFYYRLYKGELSPGIMLVIEIAGYDTVQCLKPHSVAQSPASESRVLPFRWQWFWTTQTLQPVSLSSQPINMPLWWGYYPHYWTGWNGACVYQGAVMWV